MIRPSPNSEPHRLMSQFPRAESVRWIGLLCPAREVAMAEVDASRMTTGKDLA